MFTRFNYDKDKYTITGVKLKLFDINEECKKRLFELLGLSDYVYNWAIDKEEEYIKSQGLPLRDNSIKTPNLLSGHDLQSIFIKERRKTQGLEFLFKLPIHIAHHAFNCTMDAFNRFYFRKLKSGYPKYKTKKLNRNRFGVRVDNCYIENGQLKIEGFKKGVRFNLNTNEFDNFGCKVGKCIGKKLFNPVISYDKDDFYIGFSYLKEKEKLEDQITYDTIGIDLGIRQTFTVSDGRVFQQPDCSRIEKHISDTDKNIARCNKRRRKIAKKERTNLSNIPKSNNQLKLEKKRRKLYRKIHHKKTYFYHNITTNLIRENHKAIVIEKIGARRLKKQAPYKVGKNLVKTYFYMIRNMFEYKSLKYNSLLLEADEHYPSTKRCYNCGELNHNIGGSKTFKCPHCGYIEDRDKNASYNLAGLYDEYMDGNYSNLNFDWIKNYA